MGIKPGVAIALTVYGIETLGSANTAHSMPVPVAIALTVYGIETCLAVAPAVIGMIIDSVAIALTVYGIETFVPNYSWCIVTTSLVAIALTVYGIETWRYNCINA